MRSFEACSSNARRASPQKGVICSIDLCRSNTTTPASPENLTRPAQPAARRTILFINLFGPGAPSASPQTQTHTQRFGANSALHRAAERGSTEGVRCKDVSVNDSTQSRNSPPYEHGVLNGGGGGGRYSEGGSGGSSRRSNSEAYVGDDPLNSRAAGLAQKKWVESERGGGVGGFISIRIC